MQYLPFVVFAICIVIAIMLIALAPSLWSAALAIAIAGSALALALRSQDDREIGYLTDDITVLQEQNLVLKEQMVALKKEVAQNNEMLDELADIVEQIATLSTDKSGNLSREEFEALRHELAEVRAAPGLVGQTDIAADSRSDDLEFRIAALEARFADGDSDDAVLSGGLGLTAGVATAAAATSALAQTEDDQDTSNDPQSSERGAAEAVRESAAASEQISTLTDASLSGVFQPDQSTPVAYILQAAGTNTIEGFPTLLQHAIEVSTDLEEAQRENLLFVRISADLLAEPTVRDAILAAVAEYPALQRRLAILTGQQEFGDASLTTLSTIADEGCRFGLHDVRDWSVNLASLAQNGMAFILVDGPAMAGSAKDQGGDPKRLAQALKMHDIALIAGNVDTELDIEVVKQLEPTFLTGAGLGETRALEIRS